MAQSNLVLGYWSARGLAQYLKSLTAYLNFPFEEVRYNSPTEWQEAKPTLKTNFPNLPYLIDGDKVITESEAIALYLVLKANRPDMLGEGADERILLVQLKGVFQDLRRNFITGVVFNKNLVEVQKEFNEKVMPKLSLLAQELGTKEFLVGRLTWLDFFVAEFSAYVSHQEGDWLASVPNLKDHCKRVFELPGVKEYYQGGRQPEYFMKPGFINENLKA